MSGPVGDGGGERRPVATDPNDRQAEAEAAGLGGPAIDRDLPFDGHLHTELSPDADVPIDAYAALAVERAIPEIAITDHLDFDPHAPAYRYADYDRRLRYVRAAAERWAGRVTIRFGCEVTYDSRYEPEIADHLRRHRYDFVIGSVHVYRGSPYDRRRVASWIAGRRLEEIVAPYFGEVLRAARSGLFDALGHLDFVKRYLFPYVRPAELTAAIELYDPILRALVETGTALEVNTSGLRQAPLETYPSPAAVRRFRELGGTRVTIGSDAHRNGSFAFGLAAGYRVAAESGLTALSGGRVALGGRVEAPAGAVPNTADGRSL
ncbi:MAG TPA: histidinol-phosphatase [Candidatus Limnocylindrales bacterium]|nr:histidinol-phosphatase [Candidatus Limnocylindrales bacterium]